MADRGVAAPGQEGPGQDREDSDDEYTAHDGPSSDIKCSDIACLDITCLDITCLDITCLGITDLSAGDRITIRVRAARARISRRTPYERYAPPSSAHRLRPAPPAAFGRRGGVCRGDLAPGARTGG